MHVCMGVCMWPYACVYGCMRVAKCMCVCVYACGHMHVCMCVCVWPYVCVYACGHMHVCMCVCVYCSVYCNGELDLLINASIVPLRLGKGMRGITKHVGS